MAVAAAGSVLGTRIRRVDGPEKVTGQARYGDDLRLHGLLHARLVLGLHAHARIRRIDASRALGLPGVVAVIGADDLASVLKGPVTSRASEALARGETRFCGQPVAAVLAESEAVAEDALALVDVEYDELPAVLEPLDALRPDAPAIWPDGLPGRKVTEDADDPATRSPNLADHARYDRGDVEAGFREADVVVERSYRTSIVHQGYLEPQTVTAAIDPLGTLTIWSSSHGVFLPRQALAKALGWPEHKIRVAAPVLGGGFGGKGLLVQPLAAALAIKFGRPVRLVYTRMDEFQAANPAPRMLVDVKLGARRDGTLTALDARIVVNSGLYPGGPLANSALYAGAFYRFPSLRIRGYTVVTNTTPVGAYRAPGGPQTMFALESTMDDLARELNVDPIELRLKNAAEEGDPMPNGRPWPRIGLRACLERLRDHPAWRDRERRPNEGVGVAIGGLFGGLQSAGATCRLEADGSLTVVVGSVDVSGTNTGLVLMASEALGIAPDRIRIVNADTDTGPFAGNASGSKIMLTVGTAVVQAAEDARTQLLAIAADQLEVAVDDLEIADGRVRVRGTPDRAIGLDRIGTLATEMNGKYPPVFGQGRSGITERAPGIAAHLARVRVDPDTHRPEVVGYVAVQDVGRAINPAGIEEQIHGGVAQGIGWALYEGIVLDGDGRVVTGSLLDYALPSVDKVPPIETVLLEIPSRSGPFGVRGVGEPPVILGAAAIGNTIRDATGVRLTEIPMTAERLHRALTAAPSPA
ncbi:MAG: xanthine dehydrogenase family protein molybdopterin-binding subunit [Chloroflexota bacterium]|nr:xanthine dehydrogenase family protein molybdopterin-binding subunit [Chloroflexota bacterium]